MDRLQLSIRSIMILLFCVLVAGCMSARRQTLESDSVSPVHRIAIVSIGEPEFYLVDENSHTKGAQIAKFVIGVPAIMVNGLRAIGPGKGLSESLKGGDVHFGERLTVSLEEKLRAQGYEIVRAPAQSIGRMLFVADYAKSGVSADAYLDVMILQAGYILWDSNNELETTVHVRARLVAGKNEKQVYDSQFRYGNKASAKKGEVELSFTDRVAFASADALAADYPRAIHGLDMAIEAIAEQLAADLRKTQ